MYLETVSGAFIEVSKHYIENAPRHQLIEYLEMHINHADTHAGRLDQWHRCKLRIWRGQQNRMDARWKDGLRKKQISSTAVLSRAIRSS